MSVLIPLLQLLAVAWCFALPGWLLALQLDEDWSQAVRLVVGFSVGVLAVPMICFVTAWLLGTNIRPPLVLTVGSLLNVAGGLAWWLRRRS
jgi:hypothetical protein